MYNLAFYNLAFYNLAFYNLAFYNLSFYSTTFYNTAFYNLVSDIKTFRGLTSVQNRFGRNLMKPFKNPTFFH
jgi:hypothetical protein